MPSGDDRSHLFFRLPSESPLAISFKIYPLGSLVHYTVDGRVTGAQVREFLDTVAAVPRFARGFDFLGECRGAGGDAVSAVTAVAVHGADAFEACRWAIVVPEPKYAAFAMSLINSLKILSSIAIFPTHTDAIAWLGDRPQS